MKALIYITIFGFFALFTIDRQEPHSHEEESCVSIVITDRTCQQCVLEVIHHLNDGCYRVVMDSSNLRMVNAAEQRRMSAELGIPAGQIIFRSLSQDKKTAIGPLVCQNDSCQYYLEFLRSREVDR